MLGYNFSSLFYVVLYFIFIIFFLFSGDFFSSWILIEFISLLFILISYSLSNSNAITSVIVYFVVQSFTSLCLLFFYILISLLSFSIWFFILSFLINLGAFPLMFWYFQGFYYLPIVPFFIALSFQNLPPIYIFTFVEVGVTNFYYCSILLSILIGLFLSFSSLSLKVLILGSSLYTNGWFLSSLVPGFSSFLLYFSFYTVFLILALFLITNYFPTNCAFFIFISLAGMPPFPLFFANAYVLFSLVLFSFPLLVLFLVILLSSFMLLFYSRYFISIYLLN